MKLLKKIILLFIAFIFIISCKKYPDGPLLNLYTKKHRIMGTWDVDYFSINGYDSTAYLKSKPFYGMYWFGKGDLEHDPPALYDSNTPGYTANGHWNFESKKNFIHITFDINNNINLPNNIASKIGPYRDNNVSWEIRRLTEKEFWLKTNYTDGREYFVKFKLYKNY